MRLIDADELIVMEYGGIKFVPKEFIDDAPTVDAVEVIRCKDCKYSIDFYDDGDCYCRRPNRALEWVGDWDFYCKAAERRQDDKH